MPASEDDTECEKTGEPQYVEKNSRRAAREPETRQSSEFSRHPSLPYRVEGHPYWPRFARSESWKHRFDALPHAPNYARPHGFDQVDSAVRTQHTFRPTRARTFLAGNRTGSRLYLGKTSARYPVRQPTSATKKQHRRERTGALKMQVFNMKQSTTALPFLHSNFVKAYRLAN